MGLALAASGVDQEGEEREELRRPFPSHFEQFRDLIAAPRIDVLDLRGLLPFHLGEVPTELEARVALDLARLDGESQNAAQNRENVGNRAGLESRRRSLCGLLANELEQVATLPTR